MSRQVFWSSFLTKNWAYQSGACLSGIQQSLLYPIFLCYTFAVTQTWEEIMKQLISVSMDKYVRPLLSSNTFTHLIQGHILK